MFKRQGLFFLFKLINKVYIYLGLGPSFSALNLVSVCLTDHYCPDSNTISKGNAFAFSFLFITNNVHILDALGLARIILIYQDINIGFHSVKPCVIGRFVCLCLVYSKPSGYLSSFEIKPGTCTAMFFFFIQKYQHKAESWESSIPANKPDGAL